MKKKIRQLVKKYAIIKQTTFVEDLLWNDHSMKYLNNLKNIDWHIAILSTGKFEGTNINYAKLLADLQQRKDNSYNDEETSILKNDITILEDSYMGERVVCE